MSKQMSVPSNAESPAEEAEESAPSPLQGPDSNAFMMEVLEMAAGQMPVGEDQLALDADDPGLGGGAQEAVADASPAWAASPAEDVAAPAAESAVDPGMFDVPEGKDQPTPLPGVRDKHKDTAAWKEPEGAAAFVKGEGDANEVDPNDVAQGSLGDCYLIAGMLAVARANPELIKKLIKDNGDGTYDITLYVRESATSRPKPVVKTVDGRLATGPSGKPLYAKAGDAGGGKTELWTALIEKRVAMEKGSYEQISGGNIGKDGFHFAGATEMLTGKTEGYFATAGMSEDDALLRISIALDEKKPVTCDTKNMESLPDMAKEAEALNVYGNHAYAPLSVDLDGAKISLSNPWGSDNVDSLPVKKFLEWYRGIRVGA